MPVTLKLVTPVKVMPPVQGHQITFSASDGEIGIRQGYAPLVALVGFGMVEVVQVDGMRQTWAVRGGVAQVLKDEVNILVIEAKELAAIEPAKVQARLAVLQGGEKPQGSDEEAWLRGQLMVVEHSKHSTKH